MRRTARQIESARLLDWAHSLSVGDTMPEHNARLMHWAMGLQYGSARQMAIMLFLCHIAGEDTQATASITRIMGKTGSHHTTAANSVDALIASGHISIVGAERREAGKGGKTRVYRIMAPWTYDS